MNDTSPRAESLFGELMQKRSGAERLQMGTSMFSSAREMVIAGIRASIPELDERELRAQVFLRTYQSDLSPRRVAQVLAAIRAR
jgi:hypothetical protein